MKGSPSRPSWQQLFPHENVKSGFRLCWIKFYVKRTHANLILEGTSYCPWPRTGNYSNVNFACGSGDRVPK